MTVNEKRVFTPKYPIRSTLDIIASIAGARPRPAYCCPVCGTCGCSREQHESKPVTVPLVARLMA